MKILLSWLNEYGDFADPADRRSSGAVVGHVVALGLPVDDVRRTSATSSHGVDHRRGQAPRAASRRGQGAARLRRRRRRRRAPRVVRRVQHAPGDIVPLATLGTTMPDGRTIERRGILGIDSEGMLCAADELGLGDDHSGILILPPGTPLGVPYDEALGLAADVLLDVDVTRNRPDCWGYIGIARDLARADWGSSSACHRPVVGRPPASPATAPVELVDGDRCGRFTSTVMSGVRVGPSAAWMQRRLTAAGMRPISNVVDVSNYVMLELNQPNHAYDLDTLGGGGFRVRTARRRRTDDHARRRRAHVHDRRPADLRRQRSPDRRRRRDGRPRHRDHRRHHHGGARDRVVRAAARDADRRPRLGLRSEASARYERGCDPVRDRHSPSPASPSCCARPAPISSCTPGATTPVAQGCRPSERADRRAHQPGQPDPRHALVADDLAAAARPDRLHRDGRAATSRTVALPSWRPDSIEEIDVIEEVARHYGYDRVGKTVPKSTCTAG